MVFFFLLQLSIKYRLHRKEIKTFFYIESTEHGRVFDSVCIGRSRLERTLRDTFVVRSMATRGGTIALSITDHAPQQLIMLQRSYTNL